MLEPRRPHGGPARRDGRGDGRLPGLLRAAHRDAYPHPGPWTEGILTRRLQSDPELEGVGLLIFDDFHERSLQADLRLALALDLAAAPRPDLRILVMSATLEADAVARLLGAAPVISAAGRLFPVAVRYLEVAPQDQLTAMEQTIRAALRDQPGDLLAFLTGTRETERVRAHLAGTLGEGIEVLPLHGSLTVAEQQRALVPGPGAGRQVVLATDIAETSVTIEGVTTIVDGWLACKPCFHAGSGPTRLVTEPIPLASAEQRAGRLGPGVCYRLWTRAQEVGCAPHRRAKVLDADLAPLALELALWGLRDPAALRWLDPPPALAWLQAVGLLKDLGALDQSVAITPVWRRLAELPLHPRLERMLCAAQPGREARRAADLAALLTERDGCRHPRGGASSGPGPARPSGLPGGPCRTRHGTWLAHHRRSSEPPAGAGPGAGVGRARGGDAHEQCPPWRPARCSHLPIPAGSANAGAPPARAISWLRAPTPNCRARMPWRSTPTWWRPNWTPAAPMPASNSPCQSVRPSCAAPWPTASRPARR